jgi:hypothetical protein
MLFKVYHSLDLAPSSLESYIGIKSQTSDAFLVGVEASRRR